MAVEFVGPLGWHPTKPFAPSQEKVLDNAIGSLAIALRLWVTASIIGAETSQCRLVVLIGHQITVLELFSFHTLHYSGHLLDGVERSVIVPT